MEFLNIRRLLSYARRAVDDYHMIDEGDKIAVGVSGGKDSLALLCVLHDLALFYPKHFTVCAISLDMGFEGSDFGEIKAFYEKLGIEYRIVRTNIAKVVFEDRKEKNPCSLCARMRRGILHDNAKDMGCNKLALGHHYDDVLDTFMMNLFNEGRLGSFLPVTYLSRKDITVIRPFVLTPEAAVKSFVTKNGIPVMKSPCPEDKCTDREKFRKLLDRLEAEYPGLRSKIFGAMKKINLDGYGCETENTTDAERYEK